MKQEKYKKKNMYIDIDLQEIQQRNFSANDPSGRPQIRSSDAKVWYNHTPIYKTDKRVIEYTEPSKIWFWSDQHFYHNNIIKYSNRPFADVTEMTEKMIANYNSVVGVDDVIFWLGDVSFTGTEKTNEVLGRLNGYKILVFGNHDLDRKGKLKNMEFDEIHSIYLFNNWILMHYPCRAYLPDGFYSIHGHTHTINTGLDRVVNVSVEQLNYTPISLVDLIKKHNMTMVVQEPPILEFDNDLDTFVQDFVAKTKGLKPESIAELVYIYGEQRKRSES